MKVKFHATRFTDSGVLIPTVAVQYDCDVLTIGLLFFIWGVGVDLDFYPQLGY